MYLVPLCDYYNDIRRNFESIQEILGNDPKDNEKVFIITC